MKVKFVPQNIEIDIKPNESVLQAAEANGIFIKSVCRGVPSCAECRVKVVEGDRNLMPPTAAEKNLIGSAYFVDGRRLACQLKCFGHVTIDLKDQLEKQQAQMGKRPKGRGARDDVGDSYAVRGSILAEREIEEAHRRERGELALAQGADTNDLVAAQETSSGSGERTVASREAKPERNGEPHQRSGGASRERTDDRGRDQQRQPNRQGRPHGRDRDFKGEGRRQDYKGEGRRQESRSEGRRDERSHQGRHQDSSQKLDQKSEHRSRESRSGQPPKGGDSRGPGGHHSQRSENRKAHEPRREQNPPAQAGRQNESKDPKKS